jgi:D-xylose transport system substrate-binding protein
MKFAHKSGVLIGAALATSLLAAACGSSSKSSSGSGATTTAAAAPTTTAAPAGGATTTTAAASGGSTTTASGGSSGGISATNLSPDFSTMKQLSSVASAGSGKIGVILPDTTSSARWTEFDAPDLAKAFTTAGIPSSDVNIQNAQGSDATELTDAQSDIANGAKVLIVTPLDSGAGAQIETYAKSHGVQVIDYDRLTLGGSRSYYVSFDNVKVGTLLGQGLVSCISAWGVSKPNVLVMVGAPTDNNATLFAQGYDAVMAPYFANGSWVKVGQPAGTWDPPTAETEFQQEYTAHPNINALLMPNDENAAPIITYLKTQHIGPKKFPVTGQDATLVGLQNILTGYQCGTVYKPIYLEAEATAALAVYLRAGQTPPSALVNGTTMDTTAKASVPSVLLKPEWVTSANMEQTVVADNFVPASQICTGAYASACSAAGIH